MPRVVCRTCGIIRELPHFGLYSPIHIFPGIIFVHCPKCERYRLHRKAGSSDLPPEEDGQSTEGKPPS